MDPNREEATTVEVTMPATGAVEGATVIAWLRHPGERVEEGEPICVVAWEGQTAEIDSPAGGLMRMLAIGSGRVAREGAVLAVIDVAAPAPPPGGPGHRSGRFRLENLPQA